MVSPIGVGNNYELRTTLFKSRKTLTKGREKTLLQIGGSNTSPAFILPMFLKPFTRKLRAELLTSYHLKVRINSYTERGEMRIPSLGCVIYDIRWPQFRATIGESDAFSDEGTVHLNFIEKIYLWGALRDKYLELRRIQDFNSTK